MVKLLAPKHAYIYILVHCSKQYHILPNGYRRLFFFSLGSGSVLLKDKGKGGGGGVSVVGCAQPTKTPRKHYVYWGLKPLKARFPCGNAIFTLYFTNRPLENQNSENPFLQKTLLLVGFACVGTKSSKKNSDHRNLFFPFFLHFPGHSAGFGPKFRRLGGPLPPEFFAGVRFGCWILQPDHTEIVKEEHLHIIGCNRSMCRFVSNWCT